MDNVDKVVEIAREIIRARRYAAYLSPGDKSQNYLAEQVRRGLDELDSAIADIEKLERG